MVIVSTTLQISDGAIKRLFFALLGSAWHGCRVEPHGRSRSVPFDQLIDPETLVTMVRYVEPKSDFHRLARFLETYINE